MCCSLVGIANISTLVLPLKADERIVKRVPIHFSGLFAKLIGEWYVISDFNVCFSFNEGNLGNT